jgi:hypothetical protein
VGARVGVGVGEGVGVGGKSEETVTEPDVPAMDAVVVSVAVTVWTPAVSRVTVKLPDPIGSADAGGRAAAGSLLDKRTIPTYPATMLLLALSAETEIVEAEPAFAVAGAVTRKWVTGPGNGVRRYKL